MTTIFETSRQLLAQSNTSEALRTLISHLENTHKYPGALQTLRVLEPQFYAARQKELKGILSFSEAQKEYSKINDALLSIIEDLEAGREPSTTQPELAPQQSKIPWIIGGGIMILLGLILGVLAWNKNIDNQSIAEKTTQKECPDFSRKGSRIMLIPFQNLGSKIAKPELSLQERIRSLTSKNNVDSEVEILPGDRFANSTPDFQEAGKLGANCQADMVVWGQYEVLENGISVDVRYVFTKEPNIPPGSESATLKNLTELKSNTMKFSNLEDAVFSLCTFLVLHEGNKELAVKWINKVENPSPEMLAVKKKLQE